MLFPQVQTNNTEARMKRTDFCPDEYFALLPDSVKSPFEGAGSAGEIFARSEKLKADLRSSLGIDSIPFGIAELKPETVSSEHRNGYTVETLSTEICKKLKMLCYVLIPDKPGKSGIAAFCGHGYGARQIFRQSKRGKYRIINFIDNYQKNFALELVKDGHTVIVPEFVGFGEARLKKDLHIPFYGSSCDTVSHHSLIYGFTAAGLRVYQAMRCVDILTEKYGCEEIGCMGISGGGLVSLYTACLDERIRRCCVCGYINTFRTSILARWHCPDNYIPGIYAAGDMYDYACCVAPRKLMMQAGNRDKLFTADGSGRAMSEIKRVFTSAGAEENFYPVPFDGKHEVEIVSAVKFFQ